MDIYDVAIAATYVVEAIGFLVILLVLAGLGLGWFS